MKAVIMDRPGDADVLHLAELPDPAIAGPGDMLVRLKAAGINPVDAKLRANGTYYPDRLPTVLGCDGAGVVEAVGEGVTRFAPGDAVYFCSGGIGAEPGNYAELTVVNEAYAARKPASLSFQEAAAVPLALITAWESLHDRASVQAGQRVLIHAGSGGVGHLAVQLAHLAGARVASTVGDEQRADWLRGLGVEYPIVYKKTDFVAAVRDWSAGAGVALALDTVGGETFARTFEAMAHYGDLVTLLQPDADVDWKPARLRNLRIALELMLTPQHYDLQDVRRHQREILEHGAPLFEDGRLKVAVQATYPLERAADAHRDIAAGSAHGKRVLLVSD
ncbi:MAG: zinc-dependent alcohol dehydrogenase family protein [Gammaproteobacteria bacterium]